jgi:hypothetical protein
VYWAGLGVWGIRRYAGSQSEYHRAVDQLYTRRARAGWREDDDSEPEAAHAWHPRLPEPPEGFPEEVDLRVRPDEASFLVDRITATCRESLLGWLVLNGRPAAVEEVWLHPQHADFPDHLRRLLAHARRLSDVVEGAARLYNVILAELAEKGTLADAHRDELDGWSGRLALGELIRWSLTELWEETAGFGHAITQPTRRFVEAWVGRVVATNGLVADDSGARELIRRRETALKGPRSRFMNRGALAQWGGNSGTARLMFRWPTARSFLADLYGASGRT